MSRSEFEGSRIRIDTPDTGSGPRWTLFVGGDTVVQERYADPPFGSSLRRRMGDADLTVLNLEAPVESSGEPVAKSGAVKESVSRTPGVLADAGVDAVTLANNHTMDHGPVGLFETIETCRDEGIGVCGAGADADAALAPHCSTPADGAVRVALVGLCEREFGVAGRGEPGTAWIGHPDALDRIDAAAAEADVVIVLAHGGIEYVPFPPMARRRQLRRIMDAGADIVVGHHPHVAQGWEFVRGSPVFYSLGNFLFEQTSRPNTREGFGIEITFDGDTPVSIDLVPVVIGDGFVREMADAERREQFLEYVHRVARLTSSDLEPHWQETADRVFLQRYGNWIREASGGDPLKELLNPGDHLRKGGLWDPDRRRPELLTLLNLVRNESHRAVVETALGLRTGVAVDRRTPVTRRTVRELLDRTEDRPVFDLPSRTSQRVEALVGRLTAGSVIP